jgi:hypothetical protein
MLLYACCLCGYRPSRSNIFTHRAFFIASILFCIAYSFTPWQSSLVQSLPPFQRFGTFIIGNRPLLSVFFNIYSPAPRLAGRYPWDLEELHRKHGMDRNGKRKRVFRLLTFSGPVVRIAPNQLSFASAHGATGNRPPTVYNTRNRQKLMMNLFRDLWTNEENHQAFLKNKP